MPSRLFNVVQQVGVLEWGGICGAQVAWRYPILLLQAAEAGAKSSLFCGSRMASAHKEQTSQVNKSPSGYASCTCKERPSLKKPARFFYPATAIATQEAHAIFLAPTI
ncbi:hypothetical protein GOP47_0031084 [Adiantum capillus-veneris]|nr:hypothetical protein GOP47_0031084 [Adiantum capillus-veneris]